jgi:hypothetical protein
MLFLYQKIRETKELPISKSSFKSFGVKVKDCSSPFKLRGESEEFAEIEGSTRYG